MCYRTRKEPLIYSEKFRDIVLRAYPDNEKIKELLDSNAYFLGRYLDDGCSGTGCISVSIDDIINTKGLGTQEQLFEALFESANEEKLRSLAYKMWDKEVFLD
jgi:hypothetical protein